MKFKPWGNQNKKPSREWRNRNFELLSWFYSWSFYLLCREVSLALRKMLKLYVNMFRLLLTSILVLLETFWHAGVKKEKSLVVSTADASVKSIVHKNKSEVANLSAIQGLWIADASVKIHSSWIKVIAEFETAYYWLVWSAECEQRQFKGSWRIFRNCESLQQQNHLHRFWSVWVQRKLKAHQSRQKSNSIHSTRIFWESEKIETYRNCEFGYSWLHWSIL